MTLPCCILHRHSSGSSWDGLGKPEDAVIYAKSLGQTALALTDHGNMIMALQHYFACKAHGIKPIIGIEGYHMPEFVREKTAKRHHISLFAKNFKGYQNLCQLSTRANIETFYIKPIMTFEQMRDHAEGLICLSGCVLGLLCQTILANDFEKACEYTETFLDIFGDNFYFEVQPQEFEDQRKANDGILQLAKIYDRPVVMTSDSHFISPDDLETYIWFRKMNYKPPKEKKEKKEKPLTKKQQLALQQEKESKLLETVEDSEDELETEIDEEKVEDQDRSTDDMFEIDAEKWEEGIRKQYGRLYIPRGEELADRWQKFMGTDGTAYVIESQYVADRVEEYEIYYPEKLPKAIIEIDPKTGDPIPSKVILERKTREGLKRLGKWYLTDKKGNILKHPKTQEPLLNMKYIQRCIDELKIIIEKGYEDYYLLIADMIQWARDNNVAVGPGRGSGGGSMVASAIGITEIDPVEQYCMFERFLNPSRKSLPDFDTDFGSKYAQYQVKEYMKNKYMGKCATICDVVKLTRDQLLNDLAKVMKIPAEDVVLLKNRIAKFGIGGKDKEKKPVYDELMRDMQLSNFDKKYYQVIRHFCNMYGNVRQMSVHASGLAICDDDISKWVPLFVRGKEKELYTSYDKIYLEKIGIVKADILVVHEVGALQRMCELAHVDYRTIPPNDPATYDMLCSMNTMGIFQINESPGAMAVVKAVQPRNIEHLSACIALNRPGSASVSSEDVKQLAIYVAGKNGKKIDGANSVFSQYCIDTFGALIYQEDVIRICRGVADMSWASASKVMKQLHGNIKQDDPLSQEFIQGAKRVSGMTEEDAWDLFKRFTGYTFNKGHALAYATLGYWMAYMKKHYTFEFFIAALQVAAKDYEVYPYVKDAIKNNIVVMKPHVNYSQSNYSIRQLGRGRVIQAGIRSIKGVGPAAVGPIIKERERNGPYTSEENLLERVNGRTEKGDLKKSPIKSDTLKALQDAGALEMDYNIYKKECIQFMRDIKWGKEEKGKDEEKRKSS